MSTTPVPSMLPHSTYQPIILSACTAHPIQFELSLTRSRSPLSLLVSKRPQIVMQNKGVACPSLHLLPLAATALWG